MCMGYCIVQFNKAGFETPSAIVTSVLGDDASVDSATVSFTIMASVRDNKLHHCY